VEIPLPAAHDQDMAFADHFVLFELPDDEVPVINGLPFNGLFQVDAVGIIAGQSDNVGGGDVLKRVFRPINIPDQVDNISAFNLVFGWVYRESHLGRQTAASKQYGGHKNRPRGPENPAGCDAETVFVRA